MTDADSQDVHDESDQVTVRDPNGPASDSQPLVGEWLSPPEAKQRLGISERTLYRRISGSRLRKRTLEDGRIEVWVAGRVTDTDRHALRGENRQDTDRPDHATDNDRQQTSER